MAKDYDYRDIQDALDRKRQQQETTPFKDAEIAALKNQVGALRDQVRSMIAQLQESDRRLREEMRHHNDLYKALEARKAFDDWLKEVYPETIEQYKAAMKLVEFMEDPPKPESGGFTRGNYWGSSLVERFKQQWFVEGEIEKAKIEAEAKMAQARTLGKK